MTDPRATPCGGWSSPITSDLIVTGTIGLGGVQLDGDDIYWLEHRPAEAGRYVLVRRTPDGERSDLTPAPWNVRTRVHEYGGGAYTVEGGQVLYANFADQRWYEHQAEGEPRPVSDEGYRHADAVIDRIRGRLVCVQEDHTDDFEPVNRLVSLDLVGGGPMQVLAEGNDFYAAPRISPDGSRVTYLTWKHPDMPWDATELWVVHIENFGAPGVAECVAGQGGGESVCDPRWSPDGTLYFISDRSGWWNLYRWKDGQAEPVCAREAEFTRPHWVFGGSPYAFVSAQQMVCSWSQKGLWRLGLLDLTSGDLEEIPTEFTSITSLRATATHAVFAAASPTELGVLVRLDLATKEQEVLRRASSLEVDPACFSLPEPIEFPTELEGEEVTAHALYYAPRNPAHTVPAGERPPLLVLSHGGPTSAASSSLRLDIQFWTSRGFAVVDVNYGGSSGYGRAYRQRLEGRWGIVDMRDCAQAATYLVERGEVDGERLAIRGGSAGGYTTLCALTFLDTFQAGASHFGVSDLEALARDTHKFESRYLDRLIGPYPERADLYRARSPIHATDELSCPVIILQGLEDEVVPPSQAEVMVEALRAKGIPVAYVPFEGEQHGFRKAENIKRALEAELYFYAKVFGFDLAEAIDPVEIENLSG